MQLSQVFRMGIVIPLTDETNSQFKNGDINDCVDVKLLMLTQNEFDLIWETGLFEEINSLLHKSISEYEEECIDSLEPFLRILKGYQKKYKHNDLIYDLLNKIHNILLTGNEIKMPAYFVF